MGKNDIQMEEILYICLCMKCLQIQTHRAEKMSLRFTLNDIKLR